MLATKASMQNVSATALILVYLPGCWPIGPSRGIFRHHVDVPNSQPKYGGFKPEAVANFAGTLLMEVERKTGQSF